jgi:hypothetical protein
VARARRRQEVIERERSLLAARPRDTVSVPALLSALRRIDALEADTLAGDLDCIAIENRGAA